MEKASFLIYSPHLTHVKGGEGEKTHILLSAQRPRWVVVNETGLEIAGCLNKNNGSLEAVTEHLMAKYDLAEQTARQDSLYVFNQLSSLGILSIKESAPLERHTSLGSLFLHLTDRCNLSCTHCYVSCPDQKTHHDLQTALVLQMIDELVAHGGRQITLSGGEPLLHPELKKILTYAAPKLGIRLLTNGTLIDRTWASFLADLDITIQISLDGANEEIHDSIRGRGSFSQILKAVACLQTAGLGPKIHFSTTIMKQNIHDLAGVIFLAEKLGIPQVRFLPLRRVGRGQSQWDLIGFGLSTKEYEQFYQYTEHQKATGKCSIAISCGLSGVLLEIPKGASDDELWCPVGRQLVIDTQGDVYPCVLLMHESFRLGNVSQKSLKEMIHSQRMTTLCQDLAERRLKIKKCAACTWQNLCQSGCMGQAMDQTGTIWATDDFCSYRQKAYQKAFDQIAKKSVGNLSLYRILDVDLTLESDSAELTEIFRRDWEWFEVSSFNGQSSQRELTCQVKLKGNEADAVLYINNQALPLAGHPHKTSCVYQMILRQLYQQVSDFFLLHAGVVAKDGQALMVAGSPGAGKSTLILKLLPSGYEFLSDDLCPIHRQTRLVHPFPRTAWVSQTTRHLLWGKPGYLPQEQVGEVLNHSQPISGIRLSKSPLKPDELGVKAGMKPCRLKGVLCLDSGDTRDELGYLEIGLKTEALAKDNDLLRELEEIEGIGLENLKIDQAWPESLDSGCTTWRINYPKGRGLVPKIKKTLIKYEGSIWNVYKISHTNPDFTAEPVMTSIKPYEAAFFLMNDLKTGWGLEEKGFEDRGLVGSFFMELHELLDEVPCYRLSVGRLEAMKDMVIQL